MVVLSPSLSVTPPYRFMSLPGVGGGMPRPNVDEETRDRLAEIVETHADVPASVLTFDQQVRYLLDHTDALHNRLHELQEQANSSAGRFR